MYELSHPDIPDDHLVEFTYEERFFKVPIKGVLAELGITPNKAQYYIINALEDPRYRFICSVLARRQGKSYIHAVCAFTKMLEPETNVLIVSPNYTLSDISYTLVKGFIKRFGIETTMMSNKEKKIVLVNGSVLEVGSAGRADNLVGKSRDLILGDEASLSDSLGAIYSMQLRPSLDKGINSKAAFYSTPRGRNFFYHEWYLRGFDEDFPQNVTIRCDIYGAGRYDEKDLAEAKKSMTPAQYLQEYFCDFTSVQGLIFSDLDKSKYIVDECPINELDWYEVVAGVDWGYADPTAIVHMKISEERIHVFKDYLVKNAPLSKHAEYLLEMEDKYDTGFTYCDTNNAQARADLSYTYGISNFAAKKAVLPGIGFLQSLFHTGRLTIHKDCKDLIEALDNYHWKDGNDKSGREAIDHQFSDLLDSLRYSCFSHSGHMTHLVEPLEVEEEVVV